MKSGNVLRQLRLMRGDMSKIMVEGLGDYWQAAQEADFVVGGGGELGGEVWLGYDFASFSAPSNIPSASLICCSLTMSGGIQRMMLS